MIENVIENYEIQNLDYDKICSLHMLVVQQTNELKQKYKIQFLNIISDNTIYVKKYICKLLTCPGLTQDY